MSTPEMSGEVAVEIFVRWAATQPKGMLITSDENRELRPNEITVGQAIERSRQWAVEQGLMTDDQ